MMNICSSDVYFFSHWAQGRATGTMVASPTLLRVRRMARAALALPMQPPHKQITPLKKSVHSLIQKNHLLIALIQFWKIHFETIQF